MGGYGSGRYGRRKFGPYVEETQVADVASLREHLRGHDAEVTLRLEYATQFASHCEEVRLVPRPQPFGGLRWYFVCPRCDRRCTKLHRLVGSAFLLAPFACRVCHRLPYRSQALSMTDRWRHKAEKLYRRAGTDSDADYHYRPKRMRWSTFNRLIDDAELHSNAAIGYEMRSFLRTIGHG